MFKPIKTREINNNLYAIRTLMVNLYIYDTGNDLIVFDTGMNAGLVKLGFNKLKLDYRKVTSVFLTHSDFDHVSGLKLFKNAKIYISKKEEPMITGAKARRAILYNKKIKNCNFLENSEIVNVGNSAIKLISTPGHTLGSAMYIVDDNILITGDTISLSGKGEIRNFSFIQNMNHKENIEIVNKLKEENFFDRMSVIVTGHHGIKR